MTAHRFPAVRGVLLAAAGSVALATGVFPSLVSAQLTYNVNQTVGSGTVTGQIVTNGATGPLSESAILSWNLVLNSGGATTTLTSDNSQVFFQGSDLIGSSQDLTFNFSGSGGVLAFQKVLFSGQEYYCLQASSGPCFQGANIVPQSFNDPTASFESLDGIIIIGTTGLLLPQEALELSFRRMADARFGQMIDSFTRMQILAGLNEQVNSCNGGGMFLSFGSMDLSSHGRIALTDSLTLLGGLSVGNSRKGTAEVPFSAGGAVALRYDPADRGSSRPFFEVGTAGSHKKMKFRRSYDTADTSIETTSRTDGYDFSAYARAGWVSRLSPRDEVAVSVGAASLWQGVSSYQEATGADNPFAATVPRGTDKMRVVSLGTQYTRLIPSVLGRPVEFNINGGIHRVLSQDSGIDAEVAGLSISPRRPDFTYFQVGGRLGLRLSRSTTLDLFVNSTQAPGRIGSATHGGFGFRSLF